MIVPSVSTTEAAQSCHGTKDPNNRTFRWLGTLHDCRNSPCPTRIADLQSPFANEGVVRSLCIDGLRFSALCLNGRTTHCDAATILRRHGKFLRCERTQQRFGTSAVGSNRLFAALCANGGCTEKSLRVSFCTQPEQTPSCQSLPHALRSSSFRWIVPHD